MILPCILSLPLLHSCLESLLLYLVIDSLHFQMLELCIDHCRILIFHNLLVPQSPMMFHLYFSNSLTAKVSAHVYDRVLTLCIPITIFSSLNFLVLLSSEIEVVIAAVIVAPVVFNSFFVVVVVVVTGCGCGLVAGVVVVVLSILVANFSHTAQFPIRMRGSWYFEGRPILHGLRHLCHFFVFFGHVLIQCLARALGYSGWPDLSFICRPRLFFEVCHTPVAK